MPPSDPRWQLIDRKLPPNDHARIVWRQLAQLDRGIVDQVYLGVGKDAYDAMPRWRWCSINISKRRSPATWEEEARLNVQWLGRGYTPARRTWYDFRDRIGDVIDRQSEGEGSRAAGSPLPCARTPDLPRCAGEVKNGMTSLWEKIKLHDLLRRGVNANAEYHS